MTHFFRPLIHFLFHLGYFGPLVMGVLDSSFLFLPFGNDLLMVVLVARHHQGWPFYVLAAVCGSTLGIVLLDLVARKLGEPGVRKMAGQSTFNRLKRWVGKKGGVAILLGCIAPPPFPFTMVVATTSALAYPRVRLLVMVATGRAIRFVILSFLAIRFGGEILRLMNTSAFRWTMIVFIVLCLVGSVLSVRKWLRGRGSRQPAAATT